MDHTVHLVITITMGLTILEAMSITIVTITLHQLDKCLAITTIMDHITLELQQSQLINLIIQVTKIQIQWEVPQAIITTMGLIIQQSQLKLTIVTIAIQEDLPLAITLPMVLIIQVTKTHTMEILTMEVIHTMVILIMEVTHTMVIHTMEILIMVIATMETHIMEVTQMVDLQWKQKRDYSEVNTTHLKRNIK